MKYFLCIVLCFFIFNIEAQESGIAGKVSDSESGEALIGVHVFYDKNHGIATDQDGFFRFTLPPGNYHLRLRYLGYDEKLVDALVAENKTTEIEISLKPSTTLLQGVVVSAGRFEQKLSDVTVSMEVMKPNFIEKLNVVTMETALNKVPGLTISDGQASIRGGNGWSYGVGSRVLILVDDLPMLSPDAGDAKFEFIPMENIAQVEIIKGAASALYGSSALNGAVNIRTAWPTKPSETKIILNNGIYLSPKREELKWWGKNIPFYHSTGFLHSRQNGNLDFVFGGNYYHDGGYRTENFENRYRYNLGIRYRDKKIHGLAYGVNTGFMNVDKIDFLMWQGAPDLVYIHDPASVSPTKGYRLNIDPFINFYSSRAGKHSLRSRFYRVVNNIEGDQLSNRGDQYFLEYQYHQKIKEKSSITAGLSSLQANTKAELFGDHTSANYSVFAQFDTRLWDRLSVSLGTRWENYRLDEESASSMPLFRSGLNYQLDDFTFLRASYGQGYRFPTIAEKYTYTNLGGLQILPNPNLEPETGWNTEIGIKQGIKLGNWKGYVDLAAFLTEYQNMMEFSFGAYDSVNYEPITSDTVFGLLGFQSRNIGQARITGVEFSMNGTGTIGIFDVNLLAGYTYVVPVDLNSDSIYRSLKSNADNYLKYRFSHLAKGDLEIGYKKFSLGVSYLYNSHIKNIDKYFEVGFVLPGLKEYREEHNKGFHVFDFRLAYETSDNFRFALYLKNAFNNEYMIRPGDIPAPRNVAMQVVMRF
ncbi:MAG: TonB-dependent receptor [Bacteroidales bacterium]|nr:TonB-dependent receptor [Bacteroidales bacterium]MCF8456509.1 TonB-dependent receptor [Bacteroidales bacterium]